MRRRTQQVRTCSGSGGGSGGSLAAHDAALFSVWRMNAEDPGPILDAAGNGITLAKNGSMLLEESGANALNGNSVKTTSRSTDYLSRAAGFGPTSDQDFSINIWFKVASSGIHSLFCWRIGSNDALGIHFSNDTTIQTWARNGAALFQETATVASVNDSLWHMATLTHDASDKRLITYLDSVSVINEQYTNPLNDFSAGEFRIGQFGYVSFLGSNAHFDESRFWKGDNSILTPAAIAELYNNRLGYFP